MAYITSDKKASDGGCVFCNKRDSQDDAADYIVARSTYVYMVLNIYPYNNGHVMIVPYEHVSSQEELSTDALLDLTLTTNKALAVLRKVYNPPAFNIGANIGAAAGAGIAAHYHFHIVPRWGGDANFMTVVGDTRVIPDTLENTHSALSAMWHEIFST
jgi:ATP adenylyltransferase